MNGYFALLIFRTTCQGICAVSDQIYNDLFNLYRINSNKGKRVSTLNPRVKRGM